MQGDNGMKNQNNKKNKPMFFRPSQNRDEHKGDYQQEQKNDDDNTEEHNINTTIGCITAKLRSLSDSQLREFHRTKLGVVINSQSEAVTNLHNVAKSLKSAQYIETELDDYMYIKHIPPQNVGNIPENDNGNENENDNENGNDNENDNENDNDNDNEDDNDNDESGEDEENKSLYIKQPDDDNNISEVPESEEQRKELLINIKGKLETFLDRLSIAEVNIEDNTKDIETTSLCVGTLNIKLGQVRDEILAGIDTLFKTKLKEHNENGGNIGEILIKYEEPLKQSKKMKGVFNKEFKKALELCSSRVNLLLVGASGCGKTHMSAMLAEAMGLPFGSQSCSEGMDESVFAGTILPIEAGGAFTYVESLFVHFYENGGVFLIDEGDAADANLMIFINSALGNNQFHLPRRWTNPLIKRHKDFVCIMATNTIGHGGDDTYLRNQLDGATLDRFKAGIVKMDYSETVEKSLVHPDVYMYCKMVRDGIRALQMPRIMSTRVMLDFTKLMIQQKWGIKEISQAYFMDWRADDKKRLDSWMKKEMENLKEKISSGSDPEPQKKSVSKGEV